MKDKWARQVLDWVVLLMLIIIGVLTLWSMYLEVQTKRTNHRARQKIRQIKHAARPERRRSRVSQFLQVLDRFTGHELEQQLPQIIPDQGTSHSGRPKAPPITPDQNPSGIGSSNTGLNTCLHLCVRATPVCMLSEHMPKDVSEDMCEDMPKDMPRRAGP